MKRDEYKRLRESIGTQAQAANLLGVDRSTIYRRESGDPAYAISRRDALAITCVSILYEDELEELIRDWESTD